MRFVQQPVTACATKQVSLTSSSCWRDHANTFGVEWLIVLIDVWPKYLSYTFYYGQLKSLCVNAFPSNTNNDHISRTTGWTPKQASPMCSPRLCDDVNVDVGITPRLISHMASLGTRTQYFACSTCFFVQIANLLPAWDLLVLHPHASLSLVERTMMAHEWEGSAPLAVTRALGHRVRLLAAAHD